MFWLGMLCGASFIFPFMAFALDRKNIALYESQRDYRLLQKSLQRCLWQQAEASEMIEEHWGETVEQRMHK